MLKKITLFAFIIFSFSNVSAMTWKDARKKGLLVEQSTGYLKANNPSVQSLADKINSKRKKAYTKIAEKSGAPVDVVARNAAKKIIEKLNN